MAQVTMYPANPGSPETTTSSETAIDATSIGITELGSLLAANNQCVLTDGTDFEVVVYSAKSAATGAGTITVTRSGTGHEGTAKVWPSGTAVYNSPTAYIFNCYKANIEDLDTNKQAADATLTALAGVATAANKVPYFTAEDAAAVFDLPSNKNYIQNAGFEVNQRAVASVSGNTEYPVDRWKTGIIGSSCVVSQQAFAVGQTDVPGEPKNYLRCVVTSSAGASNLVQILQLMESVRTLAGQSGVLSFYAKADVAKPISICFFQVFGSGGSPSTMISGINATKITLSTNWTKYSIAVIMPSISGKTLGTAGDDKLSLALWLDAGSDYNTLTDSLGQQLGTFEFANVKLEAGTVATPFVQKPFAEELLDCQRHLLVLGSAGNTEQISVASPAASTTSGSAVIRMPVEMRDVPTLTHSTYTHFQLWDGVNAGIVLSGNMSINSSVSSKRYIYLNVVVASDLTQYRMYQLHVNSTSLAKIDFVCGVIMTTYTVIKDPKSTILCIRRDDDGASIPTCDGNSDYQKYLADAEEHGPYPVEVIPDPVKEDPTDHDLLMAIAGILEAELA